MARPGYPIEPLITLVGSRKVVTMPEMKEALGTTVDLTVFRKLGELGYLSSYSDRGKYYTLERIARFDDCGLWHYRDVHFSRWGTLKATARQFVSEASAGYFVRELDEQLQVSTKEPLHGLFESGKLARERVGGQYLYCSADECERQAQIEARQRMASINETDGMDSPIDQVKAAIILFISTLDERQRRLYTGLEAMKLGHGGNKLVADLFKLDVHTVARGRQELESGEGSRERVRRPGGGRPPVEKKRLK